jgi:hypothetical protein
MPIPNPCPGKGQKKESQPQGPGANNQVSTVVQSPGSRSPKSGSPETRPKHNGHWELVMNWLWGIGYWLSAARAGRRSRNCPRPIGLLLESYPGGV